MKCVLRDRAQLVVQVKALREGRGAATPRAETEWRFDRVVMRECYRFDMLRM